MRGLPLRSARSGGTLLRWNHQIVAWHRAHFTNGPTEAANNLIKRMVPVASGFTSFRNYQVRSLLYASKPNWSLLETVRPPWIRRAPNLVASVCPRAIDGTSRRMCRQCRTSEVVSDLPGALMAPTSY
jgi:Transposase